MDEDDYIMFKYNDTEYKILTDCNFSNSFDMSYTISGRDEATDKLIIIDIGYAIVSGHTYKIYNSAPPYVTSAINIYFTVEDEVNEQSYVADKISEIGKLNITEKTNERLSGTFSCRMLNGEITDGRFSVKAKTYN